MPTQADCTGTWTAVGVCTPNPCPQPQLDMVLVPAGTFTMGSPTDEPNDRSWSSSEAQHQVSLTKPIYVSRHEVTQSEWQAVMGWNEPHFQGPNRPVDQVTWFDAVKYCNERSAREGKTEVYAITDIVTNGNHVTAATVAANWIANGYRLLTEAEWEYACRAGSTTAFCNGPITYTGYECGSNDSGLDLVGWYCRNAGSTTHDVGGKDANAWGLFDMHGNVWEWCWDWYQDDYPTGSVTDPGGPASGSFRVRRGGCLYDFARICRSADRGYNYPENRLGYYGLRVARTAP